MIQILYEITSATDSHQARAEALAAVLPNTQCQNIDQPAVSRVGLDTLILWGHGTQFNLCGKAAPQLKEVLKNWKRLNSGLKTVEVITCNARHSLGGDSFLQQLKGLIGWRSSLKGIKFKAMPVRFSGVENAHSILLAHYPNRSWCYVTGSAWGQYKDDKQMMEGVNLVKAEAAKCDFDLAVAANKVAQQTQQQYSATGQRLFTLNYGYFNTLRSILVEV